MTNIRNLLIAGLITAPVELKSLSNLFSVSAEITKDGKIVIDGTPYCNLDTAMAAALQHYPEQTLIPKFRSSAWQFWAWFDQRRDTWIPLEHLRGQYESRAQKDHVRTSESDPLRIDEIKLAQGALGLTFCPGKVTQGVYGGFWRRDLKQDCQSILQWRASHVITLLEEHEFTELGVPDFPEVMQTLDTQWLHLPVRDMEIPAADFENHWRQLSPVIQGSLEAGARIVIHCRGGLGRTGLLAALILIESGMLAVEAIQLVRKVRQRTIETFAQEEYLLRMRDDRRKR